MLWIIQHIKTLNFVAIATLLLAIPQAIKALKSLLDARRLRSLSIYACRVRAFNPGLIVNAYGARGFREYWPVAADSEIEQALVRRTNILLVGRPHVGKSRAAAHHIRRVFGRWWTWSEWRILRPLPYSLDNLARIRIGRHRYVLLLDDIDSYLMGDDTGGATVLQLVQHLQQQARELVVVATVRRTIPEYECLASSTRLLGRWRHIEIRDWPDEMGAHLAAVLGTDLTLWDGTPLSLIQPSSLIAEKYRQATDPEKNALRALKLCASCGLAFVPRPLLIEVSKLQGFGVHPDVIVEEPIIQSLYEKGFLMRASDWIQVYPPYLQMITDWQVSPQMREAVQVTLNDRRWSKQLVAFGAFCARTDDLQRAQSIYEAAVRLDPSNAAYYYRLGVVLSRLRLWSGAAASLQRATDISPRWPAAWYRLAHALMEQGRTHEGREAFERGRSFGSKDPRVRYQTGELLRIEGRTEDAIEEFLEAIRMDPQDAAVWHAYGQALRQQSRWSEAAKAHRRAVELRPDWAKAYFGLGEPLKELGDVDGAEQAYRKAIDLRPDIGEVYTYMSKLLEKNGRIEEAERALREGLQHCPNEARIHSYLGQVLSNMHRNNEALEEFRIALELKPSYVEAHVGLSTQQRFLRGSDPQLLEEAIRNNKRAIEIDPDCASAHYGLGMCYLNKKMCDAAVQSFREALRCDPEMGMVWYRLAIALRCADASEEEALDCLKRAERLGYDTNKVKLESARLFVQKGWTGDALRLLGELAQANGGMLPEVVAKDGAFQSIREDPYFVALLHKL